MTRKYSPRGSGWQLESIVESFGRNRKVSGIDVLATSDTIERYQDRGKVLVDDGSAVRKSQTGRRSRVNPSSTSTATKGTSARATGSQRYLGRDVKQIVPQRVRILKRTILGKGEQVVNRILAIDLYDWRWLKGGVTVRSGQDVRVNVDFRDGLAVNRYRDEWSLATKVENQTDAVWDKDEMAVVGELKGAIHGPAKFVLAGISTGRDICLYLSPSGKKVVWLLDFGCILDISISNSNTKHEKKITYLGWRVREVFERRLPVEIRINGIDQCNGSRAIERDRI